MSTFYHYPLFLNGETEAKIIKQPTQGQYSWQMEASGSPCRSDHPKDCVSTVTLGSFHGCCDICLINPSSLPVPPLVCLIHWHQRDLPNVNRWDWIFPHSEFLTRPSLSAVSSPDPFSWLSKSSVHQEEPTCLLLSFFSCLLKSDPSPRIQCTCHLLHGTFSDHNNQPVVPFA